MKEIGIKPNYAQLARSYQCDYRTVKRYYQGYEGKPRTRDKPSHLDKIKDQIRAKLGIKGVSVRGVYEYFIDQRIEVGSYSNFAKYVKKEQLKPRTKALGNPRFETLPGIQAQCDWKESIKLHSRSGQLYTFNVFNFELGFSRHNHLIYSKTMEQNVVKRALIDTFKRIGGVPKEIVFDNMTTVVTLSRHGKKVNSQMARFARDFGFKIRLCKARHAYTKGKVEARNKIIEWINAYDYDFEDENELIAIIEKVNQKMNHYICQATNQPPILLLQKETEYLNPLPPQSVIDGYQATDKVIVGKDSLIYYQGNRYSVHPALIGESVGIETNEGKLYIYYNQKLQTIHELKPCGEKTMTYQRIHYRHLMEPHYPQDSLAEVVEENLKIFDQLLGE